MNISAIHRVRSVSELAALLRSRPQVVLLGGGTLAVPAWQDRKVEIVPLTAIEELHRCGTGEIGAATTLARIAADLALPAVLREAASSVAGPAVRNLATAGGNVGSRQPACLAVALLALDATVGELAVHEGEVAWHPLEAVLRRPPAPVIALRWSPPPISAFEKVGVRAAGGPNLATVAAGWWGADDPARCSIAAGSTGTVPHRLRHAERTWARHAGDLRKAARASGETAAREVEVGVRDTGERAYQRHLVANLVERALLRCVEATQGKA
ncbi:FAD binding domain-containing protein [Nonomuraea sp. B1E8]|uniref:FAD binding domain-containing protein n=1 Tax=unclassified Nonomuraea TaxID=2593643 RepID=UPI00325CE1E7